MDRQRPVCTSAAERADQRPVSDRVEAGVAFHKGPIDHPSAGRVGLETEALARFFDTLAVGDEVQVR